jgi:hypothetical protein
MAAAFRIHRNPNAPRLIDLMTAASNSRAAVETGLLTRINEMVRYWPELDKCFLIFAIGLALIAATNVRSASAQFFPFTREEPRAPTNIPPVPQQRFEQGSPAQPGNAVNVDPAPGRQYAALYAPVYGEPFPIPAVRLADIHPEYLRKAVFYPTHEPPGTIVIDPQNHFLYLVQGGGRALRYGVGVGRQGFGWAGLATIHDKQEWPDWYRAAHAIRSVLVRCISGRATRIRSTASTARSSRGPSAGAFPPAASA